MRPGDDPLRDKVSEVRSATVTQRLRQILLATLAVLAMVSAATVVLHEPLPHLYMRLRLVLFLTLLGLIANTYRPAFPRHQVAWTLGYIVLSTGLVSYAAVLRDNLATAAILDTMMLMLTSGIVPWGMGPQALGIAVCLVSLAPAAWHFGVSSIADPNAAILLYASAGMALSLFVAHTTRRNFDRAARENLKLQAADEEIRSLAEQLESKVRDRTAELESSLADQQSLTRAISHDLRQPLRHIQGFTQMFADDLGSEASEERRDQISRVCAATARMDRMVDALLELSRVGGKPIERQRIDLSRMATELGAILAGSEADHRVELHVEDGLEADGDPALVRTMMHQLLVNAWKFTRGRSPAHVHVGRDGDAFFVRDDGSGFDMQHASRLFWTFERLHHFDEFEGEGVGLAIAERVVRRHGGRIRAESRPGEGATFYFTLEREAEMPGGDTAADSTA